MATTITRKQLEEANEAINEEISEKISARNDLDAEIDALQNQRLANGQEINRLLREELEMLKQTGQL